MDERRKRAYRDLLYWAMLDLRSHGVTSPYSRPRWWSAPFWLRVLRRLQHTMLVADWLHNLAFFSSVDFEAFDEACFWRELDIAAKRFPAFHWAAYRSHFDFAMETLPLRRQIPSPAPDDIPPQTVR